MYEIRALRVDRTEHHIRGKSQRSDVVESTRATIEARNKETFR